MQGPGKGTGNVDVVFRFARDLPVEGNGFEPSVPLRSKLSRLPGTPFAKLLIFFQQVDHLLSRERCTSRSARRHVFARATLRRTQVKPGRSRPVFIFTGGKPSPR